MVPFFSIIGSFKSPAGTSLYVNFLGNKSIVFFQSSFDIISCKLSNCKICSCFPKSIDSQRGSSMYKLLEHTMCNAVLCADIE